MDDDSSILRITRQKPSTAESSLSGLEQLVSISDGIDQPVYISDPDNYDILYANQALIDAFGSAEGKKCYQVLQERGSPCDFCTNRFIFDEDREKSHIWEYQNRKNSRWYHCIDRAVRRADGKLLRYELAIDISRQKETEDALVAEQGKLSVALRLMAEILIFTDPAGRIVLMNKAAEELTGWTMEKVIGKHLDDVLNVVDEKTYTRVGHLVDRILNKGRIVDPGDQMRIAVQGQNQKALFYGGAPVYDKHSSIVGVILILRNVTDEIEKEARLLEAQDLKSLGVFAASIAHDLNNTLTVVLGNISLARIFPGLEEKVYEKLVRAEKASMQAKDLTNQLFSLSRGKSPMLKVTSLKDLLKDAEDNASEFAGIDCQSIVPDDLWLVKIDKLQISQVINNIIVNARQAMPEGGTISIKAENVTLESGESSDLKAGKYVKVSVEDHGVGIRKEFLARVFEPSFTTKQKGSGFGLAVAQFIIDSHGGHISVESQLGVGTTFSFYLPACSGQDSEDGAETNELFQGAGRVLVMDDEEVITDFVFEVLTSMGYDVAKAQNGTEAVELYKSASSGGKAFDAVILNLMVQNGMGGVETIEELQKINPGVKAVVSSGYSNHPVMINFEQYGFCAALAKPYKVRELGKVMSKVTGASASRVGR